MPFFSPPTAPAASSSPLGRYICHREGSRVKGKTRSYRSRSCVLAPLRALSIFCRQQPRRTGDYLDRGGDLFLPSVGNKAARLLDTKQTAAPSAKRTPASDYQKDATPNPIYYFQFLLQKVNLMSIIGS